MSIRQKQPPQRQLQAHEVLLPDGWPKPSGYANGMVSRGTFVFLGGQVGWNEKGEFPEGIVAQIGQALENIVRILSEANAPPETVVRMVWYITDIDAYVDNLRDIGGVYRSIFGYHYPTMTLVQVLRLLEPKAMVEIEATAVIPE